MTLVLAGNLIVTSAMLGVIWLIQLVHYPMFKGLDHQSFVKWHGYHSRQITYLVAPLMIVEMIASASLAYIHPDIYTCTALVVTIGIWAATFGLSVPIHNHLGHVDLDLDRKTNLIEKLVQTNWPRTALYSIKLVVLILLLFSIDAHL